MQKRPEEEGVDSSLLCPSFNSYSSDQLAHVADRVSRDYSPGLDSQNDRVNDADHHDAGSSYTDGDFEFVTFRKASDGIFFDGLVGPVFPIFNRDLLAEGESGEGHGWSSNAEQDVMALQVPMRKLVIHDKDQRRHPDPPSSSSSEVDELEGVPPGTYCVWTPNPVKASPSRCKKSNSTGSSSSKRWKLLDLLRRSNSDGKDSFVFLTPSSSSSASSEKKKKEEQAARAEKSSEQRSSGSGRDQTIKVAGKQKAKASAVSGGHKKMSAHEAFYVRNRELKKSDNRRSYLPYRQDLVGFCASLNGMGKAFPPF